MEKSGGFEDWADAYQTGDLNFRIPARDKIGEEAYCTVLELMLDNGVELPLTFYEPGSGEFPLTRYYLEGYYETCRKKGIEPEVPVVILDDPDAYKTPRSLYVALAEIVISGLYHPTRPLQSEDIQMMGNTNLSYEERIELILEMIKSRGYADLTISTEGLGKTVIPPAVGDINFICSSLGNYVPTELLDQVMTDKRVRTVTFLNGSEVGSMRFGNLFVDTNSNLEDGESTTMHYLRILGESNPKFINLKTVLAMSQYISPAIGVILLRPKGDEAERIQKYYKETGESQFFTVDSDK